MGTASVSFFALHTRAAYKRDGARIGADRARFAAIAAAHDQALAALDERLARLRALPGRSGEAALERDLDVHRLSGQRALLRRFGVDLCLGRMTPADGSAPIYVGRAGITDGAGRRLLVDWRAPAAEPFFAATLTDPRGLRSRRRYRWAGGRVVDYWDELLADPGSCTETDETATLALDDQSSFLASLTEIRSDRMRDVLTTIQADQHAVVRADARGALVVDGGPGTGKTVVALHRAAYLLATDPRLGAGRGGVLFIGPGQTYLSHIDDVLPSLGEESVRVQTLRDLVPEAAVARTDDPPAVAAIKGRAIWPEVIARAVRACEQPPVHSLVVETPWGDVELGSRDWAEAFDAPEPGALHDEGRDQMWAALCEIVADRIGDGIPFAHVQRALANDADLADVVTRAWPLLSAGDVVAALWSRPALLRRCAPELTDHELAVLHRGDARAWTTSDLPLLDAARALVGEPGRRAAARRRAVEQRAERVVRDQVAADLIAADDSELGLMSILRGQDAVNSLASDDDAPGDPLSGPFAHVIIDEAQELTDAEWRMLVRRCPSRSFTVVGDRAQARQGFAESWTERLARVGVRDVRLAHLQVNYRTPGEVMDAAAPLIRAAMPDANVPVTARRSGLDVERVAIDMVPAVVDAWRDEHADARACIIGDPFAVADERVDVLSPVESKGLEYDLVVLVRPGEWGDDVGAAVDRYVAMTRTTRRLVIAE